MTTRTYEPILHERRKGRTSITARITLIDPGVGIAAAWCGFSELIPGRGWVQAGVYTTNGVTRAYFEFSRLRYKLVTGPNVGVGETVVVSVSRKWGRWVADFNGKQWMSVPLTLPLPMLFVGVERFDDATVEYRVDPPTRKEGQ